MKTTKWSTGLALAIPFFAIAGLLSSGCGQGANSSQEASTARSPEQNLVAQKDSFAKPVSAPRPNTDSGADTVFRQVVRKGDLSVRVESVDKSEKEVNRIVTSVGGFTETASSKDLANHPVMNMALRVPSPVFEDVMSKFESLGVRLAKSVETQDVTNQLAALESHLQKLRAKEALYRSMKKKPAPGEDRYATESQLADVRNQIQTTMSDQKAQSGIAALSTITLTLEQGAVAGSAGNDPKWLAESFGQATEAVGTVFRGLVTILMWLVVFSPIWIPVMLLMRKINARNPVIASHPPTVAT